MSIKPTQDSQPAIENLLGKDVPADKLLLGVAFFGEGWTGVSQAAPALAGPHGEDTRDHHEVAALGATIVRGVMDDAPLTCTPATELDEVRRMMLGRHARYMPVLSEKTLMGVVSFYDVAKAVVDSQDFENRMLKAYIRDWPVESRDELPSSNPN